MCPQPPPPPSRKRSFDDNLAPPPPNDDHSQSSHVITPLSDAPSAPAATGDTTVTFSALGIPPHHPDNDTATTNTLHLGSSCDRNEDNDDEEEEEEDTASYHTDSNSGDTTPSSTPKRHHPDRSTSSPSSETQLTLTTTTETHTYIKNPLLSLRRDYTLHQKSDFLDSLKNTLQDPTLTRENILEFFTLLKNFEGPFHFLHEQRHPGLAKFSLFFKRDINPGEDKAFHTKSFQMSVKMLKNHYLELSKHNTPLHSVAETQFLNYFRGNAPLHRPQTTSYRAFLKMGPR